MSKDNPELRDALAAAVQKVIDDGTYEEIMRKWHWPEDQILPETAVNPTN